MEKTQMNLNIEDINLLNKITTNDEKTQIEQQIIESLYELNELHSPYKEKEDRFLEIADKREYYHKQTRYNICKAAICGFLAMATGEAIFKGDVNTLEALSAYAGSTIVGAFLLQRQTKKNDMYDIEEYMEAEYDYYIENEKLEEKLVSFIKDLIAYSKYYKNATNWDDISDEIFKSNKNYIERQIETGNFEIELNKEEAKETLEFYLGDLENLDDVIEYIFENDEIKNEDTEKALQRMKK